jgi:hypothetical protein
MPFFGSILLAAGLLALPADAQPDPAIAPAPPTLSPNNCGTPDTPKPCPAATGMNSLQAMHKTSPISSQHK